MSTLFTVTVAPETTAADWSVTVPERIAETWAVSGEKHDPNKSHKELSRNCLDIYVVREELRYVNTTDLSL